MLACWLLAAAGADAYKEALLELCSRDAFALAAMSTLLQGLANNRNLSSLSPQALGPLQVPPHPCARSSTSF